MALFIARTPISQRFWAWLVALAVLLFGYSSISLAEAPPSNQPWAQAKQLADDQKNELGTMVGFPVRVLEMERNTQSPFVALVQDGQCVVILNKNLKSWIAWDKFRDMARLSPQDSYYFALLHEVGHCVNKLNPTFTQSVLPEGVDSELYADVFALLAARRLLDQESAQIIGTGIVRARLAQNGFFFRAPSHDTGSKLKVIQQMLQQRPELLANQANEPGLLARRLVEETRLN
jgi:hypothetical protein